MNIRIIPPLKLLLNQCIFIELYSSTIRKASMVSIQVEWNTMNKRNEYNAVSSQECPFDLPYGNATEHGWFPSEHYS